MIGKIGKEVTDAVELAAAKKFAAARKANNPSAAEASAAKAGGEADVVVDNVKISGIIIGPRIRTDFRCVEARAEDIRVHGLHYPVCINKNNRLIDGECRIRAVQLLGWDTIPAIVEDISDEAILEREVALNVERESFNCFEAASAADRLMEKYRKPVGRPKKGDVVDNPDSADVNITAKFAVISPGRDDLVDWASQKAGLGCRRNYEKVKAIEGNALDEVRLAAATKTISIHRAYVISQQKRGEQLTWLNESIFDDDTDRKSLRAQAAKRHLKKRLVKAGIDLDNKLKEKGLADDGEDALAYNLLYAHIPATARDVDVNTLGMIPISPYTFKETIVCISCKNAVLPQAIRLLNMWGLYYSGTITVADSDVNTTTVNHLGGATSFVVIGKTHPNRQLLYGEINFVPVDTRRKASIMGREVVENVFGEQAAYRMLDLCAKKDSLMDGRWANYQKLFGI